MGDKPGVITPFREEGTVHVVFPTGEAYQATMAAVMEMLVRTEANYKDWKNKAEQATLEKWRKQCADQASNYQKQKEALEAALKAMQP